MLSKSSPKISNLTGCFCPGGNKSIIPPRKEYSPGSMTVSVRPYPFLSRYSNRLSRENSSFFDIVNTVSLKTERAGTRWRNADTDNKIIRLLVERFTINSVSAKIRFATMSFLGEIRS